MPPQSILRELGEDYTYKNFLKNLNEKRKSFNIAQQAGLAQRMALLESLMDPTRTHTRASRFEAGQLTIVDLSDPFIDSSSACGIFEVVLRLFTRTEVGTGKVLVVDEAHKVRSEICISSIAVEVSDLQYLSSNEASSGLTKSLITLIREQRHKGLRVVISTQGERVPRRNRDTVTDYKMTEPTVVPPVVLDLCTLAIMHRFSSPTWWNHIMRHTSAEVTLEAFDKIVKLKVCLILRR